MSNVGKYLGYIVVGALIIFILAPILIIIPVSFGANAMFTFPPKEWSFANYTALVNDSRMLSSVWLSIYVAIASVIIACLIGVCSALGIVKGRMPFSHFLESFFLGPLIVPFVTTGIGLLIFFVSIGLVGTSISIIFAHSVIISPYVVRIAIASLRHSDPTLEEVAIVHGASGWYTFKTVVLPQLRPAIISGSLLAFLVSIDEYTVTIFLAQADTITLPIRIFQYVTLDINPVVTALSSVTVILSFILVFILEKKFKVHKYLEF